MKLHRKGNTFLKMKTTKQQQKSKNDEISRTLY